MRLCKLHKSYFSQTKHQILGVYFSHYSSLNILSLWTLEKYIKLKMAAEQKAEGTEQTNVGDSTGGIIGKIEAKYHELKQHAEEYPYVWGSYAIVYGGFGLWFAYRWRKLRRTEVRVRALQERQRQLAQAEESANKSSKTINTDKPPNSH